MLNRKQMLSLIVALAFVPLALATEAPTATEQPIPTIPETPETPPVDAPGIITDRWIVGFYELPDQRQAYAGFPILEVNDKTNFFIVRATNEASLRAAAIADSNVRYIEWDDPFYAQADFVPNDSRYNDAGHWGSKRIGGEAAWDRTLGSTAVKVAHIDSGLNKGHQDIARYLQGYDFVNNDNDPNDESGCSYHGTHTTGTAAATIDNGVGIAGMAQSTVLPIKAFYPTWLGCSGSTSALISGLQYAADQGSHLSSNSWGGGASTGILDAIQYAHDLGTIHIAAAGNDGPCTNCVGEPWKSKASITIIVASSTSSDAQSSFSNEGPEIDVIAPGSSILSTTSGTSGYSSLSGTSMAAPHVTGVAALALACDASLNFAQMESLLTSTAEDIGLSSNKQGAGLVDADAVTAAECGGAPPNNPPSASFTESCTGLTCNFTDTSTDSDGSVVSWSWTFGDGGSSTAQHPSHTYATGGTYTVSLTVTDDDGATDSTSHSVTVSSGGGPTQVHYEDWDDGAGGGYTISTGALWHLNTGCGAAHSGSYKAVWADSTSCTYDVGDTGLQWLKSPQISLAGYGSATASFYHWFETESYSGGAYDVLTFQYSCNDSTWTTLEQWDSRNPNVPSWTQESYDVSACAGGNLWLRWTGDSIDGSFNNYAGWRVDTVEVTAS